MASHNNNINNKTSTNNINNNVVASVSSCNNKPYDDHAHTINKRKRDHAPPEKRKRRRRNNNSGKLTFNPYLHDTNDVCLCLSLSCRHRTATTTHDVEKKKTCNIDDSAVGKHNNLKLLQPIHDSTVCLHFLPSSPSCGCDQIAAKQKLGGQETNAVDDQQWEFKKVLTKSDVCHDLIRLMLNKDLADKFIIPHLLGGAQAARKKKGVQVKVWDFDEKELHSLVFKIWASDKYYVFTKTWIRDFVGRRKLKKGDRIGIRWDQLNNRFEFSVLRREVLVCNSS